MDHLGIDTREAADRFQPADHPGETDRWRRGYQARATKPEESSVIVPVLGILVPIIAIVLGLGVVMLSTYLNYRKRREMFQLYHAERMTALEKGIELPALPDEFFQGTRGREPLPARNRRIGLIVLFLGIALTLALWRSGDADAGEFWWGLLPVGLGLAYLLAAFLEAREQRHSAAAPPDGETQARIGRV
jgi:hypothetical protein